MTEPILSLAVRDALEDVLSIELSCSLTRTALSHIDRALVRDPATRITVHYMDRRTLMIACAVTGIQWQLIKTALRDLPQATVTNSPMRTAGSDILLGNANEPHVWITWATAAARK